MRNRDKVELSGGQILAFAPIRHQEIARTVAPGLQD
jgi:hypothetical protein